VRRRAFLTLLGAAATAACPRAARAQQPKVPVIGYLGAGSAAASAGPVAVFRQSRAEAGYVVGRNAAIEYRFAEGQYDRLPAMAAELVRSEVALIVATTRARGARCNRSGANAGEGRAGPEPKIATV